MSSTVFQIVTSADFKQLGRTIFRIRRENGKTGSCKPRAQFTFWFDVYFLQWCDLAPPNGLDYMWATSNHEHRVYGHMPNSLTWVLPPATVPAVPRAAVTAIPNVNKFLKDAENQRAPSQIRFLRTSPLGWTAHETGIAINCCKMLLDAPA